MLKPKNKKEDKVKLTKESYSKAAGIFRYLKPYGFIYFIGWIFLVLSTSAGLVFPYLLGKLLGTANVSNMQDSVELISTNNINNVAFTLFVLFGFQALFSPDPLVDALPVSPHFPQTPCANLVFLQLTLILKPMGSLP